MKVDLHIHTTYSDGAFSPEKIVDTALESGLEAIAISDHDNVLSYSIAKEYAKDKTLEIAGNYKKYIIIYSEFHYIHHPRIGFVHMMCYKLILIWYFECLRYFPL